MTIPELEEALAGTPGKAPYRARQIFSRISGGACSFEEMTNLPLPLRKELAEQFRIRGIGAVEKQEDRDGTVKLRLGLPGGAAVETVLLSSGPGERLTACLSTQAGCPVACVFCKTGNTGFLRNLEAWEIVEQVLVLSGLVRGRGKQISHIVVMGMGEPLLNLPALRKALEILCDPRGLGFSKRKITVSTSGIYRSILDMAENGPRTELALSITTAREELRRRLMPGSAKNPLDRIKEALKVYQEKQKRRITLETVLLGGINTTEADARALAHFARGLYTLVNLIPWNPVAELRFDNKPLRKPPAEETGRFRRMLEDLGLEVSIRYRRGRGVCGACGQLGTAPVQGDDAAVAALPLLSYRSTTDSGSQPQ
ncbi:MAG: 23S rRNA (adenine(2503)-C(2))-methyltransferase RlmN [Spirochaetaceae bacterium]|jgi:23S rRNA (adenine2503-C2)-methyltransferase|nr:23S rRNA (adenine(2503)-C(2))-methyltransferase RlmN [Spirochaetaceae bacterium]